MKFFSTLIAAVAAASVVTAMPSVKRTDNSDSGTEYTITDPYYSQNVQQFCVAWYSVCNVLAVVGGYTTSSEATGPTCAVTNGTNVEASCIYQNAYGNGTADVTGPVGSLFVQSNILECTD